ncbi:hypothetical protein O181_006268 [Austropuccinia psidii MF-1]|uniref:Uncharacterized protein n=1 Tax=Austropuccinia psidii MF-1 TaxID=1389203 RepID=A0A9Q3GGE5_9BASI|nr:hypothetical protein [Austropuccinia psidii MF-1]
MRPKEAKGQAHLSQRLSSGNHHRPSKAPPQFKGKPFPQLWTPNCRNQECGIYGIIYHYAPFFFRNSMVIVSRPPYIISNQVPRSITQLQRQVSVIQCCNPWWPSEYFLRTPTNWSFRFWLFNFNSIHPKGILAQESERAISRC